MVFASFFVILGVTSGVQITRILLGSKATQRDTLLGEHIGILLICVLRALQMFIQSTRPLVGMVTGCICYWMEFHLFAFLATTWAGTTFFAMEKIPFTGLRPYFIVASCVLTVTTICTSFAVLLNPANAEMWAKAGSYLIAATTSITCIIVVAAGKGHAKNIPPLSSVMGKGDAKKIQQRPGMSLGQKVARLVMLVAVVYLIQSVLWVMMTSQNVINNGTAFIVLNGVFHAGDWFLLLGLLAIFKKAVEKRYAAGLEAKTSHRLQEMSELSITSKHSPQTSVKVLDVNSTLQLNSKVQNFTEPNSPNASLQDNNSPTARRPQRQITVGDINHKITKFASSASSPSERLKAKMQRKA